jgi:hypothetical protein
MEVDEDYKKHDLQLPQSESYTHRAYTQIDEDYKKDNLQLLQPLPKHDIVNNQSEVHFFVPVINDRMATSRHPNSYSFAYHADTQKILYFYMFSKPNAIMNNTFLKRLLAVISMKKRQPWAISVLKVLRYLPLFEYLFVSKGYKIMNRSFIGNPVDENVYVHNLLIPTTNILEAIRDGINRKELLQREIYCPAATDNHSLQTILTDKTIFAYAKHDVYSKLPLIYDNNQWVQFIHHILHGIRGCLSRGNWALVLIPQIINIIYSVLAQDNHMIQSQVKRAFDRYGNKLPSVPNFVRLLAEDNEKDKAIRSTRNKRTPTKKTPTRKTTRKPRTRKK